MTVAVSLSVADAPTAMALCVARHDELVFESSSFKYALYALFVLYFARFATDPLPKATESDRVACAPFPNANALAPAVC